MTGYYIMKLFYSNDTVSDTCILSEEESRHCISVLRCVKGDCVHVFSGDGNLCTAEILEADSRKTLLRITERAETYRRPYYLHLAIAPTKNFDRYEWFLEKALEIGIDEITPLICARSERKTSKFDRMQKVIIAAMKQSGNLHAPVLNRDTTFDNLLSRPFEGIKCIAHCEASDKQTFAKVISGKAKILLLAGPEGDFTAAEISKAIKNEFIPVTLGNSTLRTETAGVFACSAAAVVHYTNT